VRLPHGEFIEVHAPLDEYKRYKLVGFESPAPLPAVPNDHGVVTREEKRRAALSRWFFEDRVAPASPAELEAAHGHHAHPEAVEASEAEKSLSH
jgi:ubiquinol-cytochrome c reductase cytochrome b subunit